MGGGLPNPVNLPGVVLAGLATVGSGLVLGPEAFPIALGTGHIDLLGPSVYPTLRDWLADQSIPVSTISLPP